MMPSLYKMALCLLFLLTFFCRPAVGNERLEVEIRSSILNVRQTTSTKSPVVEVLQQGDQLFVTTTGLQDWIKLDDNRGFISIHYVNVLSRTPLPQPEIPTATMLEINKALSPIEYAESPQLLETAEAIKNTAMPEKVEIPTLCTADQNNTRIELKGQSKICRKNLQTMGYESCEIIFNFNVSTSCTEPSQINVQCAANVVSQETGELQKQTELSIQELIPITESLTSSLRLNWTPDDPESPVTQVQLSEGKCQLAVR